MKMGNVWLGILALLSVFANVGRAQTNESLEKSVSSEATQKVEVSTDRIWVRLTPEQREDLYKILKEIGVKVGDWKTYDSNAAPSKCTGSVD